MAERPEARPRRLVSRYALSLPVQVQSARLPPLMCEARNVSVGGLFLATDTTPELLSELQITLTLPDSTRSATFGARVAHVLSAQRARGLGLTAGVGVQLERFDQQGLELITALVSWARERDPRPRIACIEPGVDRSAIQHEPMLGFLLEYVDGKRDPEALAQELALDIDTIERMLGQLHKHGVIQLVAASSGGAQPRPNQGGGSNVSQQPLPAALREELSTLECRLPTADYYELLGVAPDASPEQARDAYIARNAELHASIRPPAEAQRIDRVLGRLRDACNVLTHAEQKDEYDEYMERAEWLKAAEAMRARLTAPPPPPAAEEQPPAAKHLARLRASKAPSATQPPASAPRQTSQEAASLRAPRAAAGAANASQPSAAEAASLRAPRVPSMPPPAASTSQPAAAEAASLRAPRVPSAGAVPGRTQATGPAATARGHEPRAHSIPPAAADKAAVPASNTAQPLATAKGAQQTSGPVEDARSRSLKPAQSRVVSRPLSAPLQGDLPAKRAQSVSPTTAKPSQPPAAAHNSEAPASRSPSMPPTAAAKPSQFPAAPNTARLHAARGRLASMPPSRPKNDAPGAAAQILAQAEAAFAAGQTTEASRHLTLLSAMTFEDPRVKARLDELKLKVVRAAAVDFEKQAAYEEKHQRWALAAASWLRVAKGRPNDSYPLRRAAFAQLQAGVELRLVMETAKRAVDLAPNDAQAHRTLAKVYMAADMQASARRELELAQRCSPMDDAQDDAKAGLLQRLLGRDDED